MHLDEYTSDGEATSAVRIDTQTEKAAEERASLFNEKKKTRFIELVKFRKGSYANKKKVPVCASILGLCEAK